MEINIRQILDNLGIAELSKMQETTYNQPDNKDIILLSPTGSGKTIAYILLILKSLSSKNRCIIITPSRELCLQIEDLLKKMSLPINCACCYGGHSASEERNKLNNSPEIIIGTPGRIADHIDKGSIETSDIRIWVVDEFDKVLELGFKEQIEYIYHNLPKLNKRIFVSATYSEDFMDYIRSKENLNILDYTDTERKPSIKQYIVKSEQIDKIGTLIKLLHDIGPNQSIVFCNYRESVDRVSEFLKKEKISHVAYHGGMEQMDREKALSRFKSKSVYTLITTDLASRGLDISDIDSIIHYHIPNNRETFIHRNGRTARWDTSGRSFLILNEKESIPDWMDKDIETYRITNGDREIPQPEYSTIYIGKGKHDKISKGDIMGFLCKKAMLNKDDIGIIIVKEKFSFAAVKSNKVKQTIKMLANEKIKGLKTIVEIANS